MPGFGNGIAPVILRFFRAGRHWSVTIEWHPGEQHIREGKYAFRWTRLSCRKFRDTGMRLQLHALVCNPATLPPAA